MRDVLSETIERLGLSGAAPGNGRAAGRNPRGVNGAADDYPGDHALGDLAEDEPPTNGAGPIPFQRPAALQVREAEDDPHRLARLFLRDHVADKTSTLRWWRDEWLRWEGHCYRALPDKELRAELSERVKREFDARNLEALARAEEGKPPPTARKVTVRVVSDALHAMQGMALLPASAACPSWLGAGPFPAAEVLACRNTLVHLPSWAAGRPCTQALTPRFFSVNALDYDFATKAAPPRRWLEFLAQLWPDDAQAVAALQEWFGYCLLPDTRYHKILMIVGPRRSGKGTIARVLRAVVGVQNTASPTLAGLGTQFGLWPLLGKTLAVISDARLSGRTDAAVVVERLLSISGEDAQTIDRKNLPPVTTTIPIRFMVLTNELPKLADPSGALVGRLVALRQTRSWFGKEDTGLTDCLLAELPGILLWSMAGWKRLRERGHFEQPKSAGLMVQDMEDLSSPISAFVRERCEVGAGHEVAVKDLFSDWKVWCETKGRKEPGTEQVFGRDLRAALPHIDDRQPRTESGRIRVYVGVRLRPFDVPEGEEKTPFG
jgi:putative DNA primase/helicase